MIVHPERCPELRADTRAFLDRRATGSGLLIDGAWQSAESGRTLATLATLDPATGEEIGRIASASAGDVDQAVNR